MAPIWPSSAISAVDSSDLGSACGQGFWGFRVQTPNPASSALRMTPIWPSSAISAVDSSDMGSACGQGFWGFRVSNPQSRVQRAEDDADLAVQRDQRRGQLRHGFRLIRRAVCQGIQFLGFF